MTWAAKVNGLNTPKSINGRTNFNVQKVNGMRGFIPTDIGANLKVWIDPASETYNNGDSVPTAHDRSGGGLDYTQAVALTQPTFQTSGINTRKAFAFSGAQILSGPAGSLTLAQNIGACAIFGVGTIFNTTSQVFFFSNNLAINNSRVAIGFMATSASRVVFRRLDADAATVVSNVGAATQEWGGVFDFSNNLVSSYVDGVAGNTSTVPSGAGNTSNTASLASSIGAGGAVAGGSPYTGSVGDLIFVLGVPSAATLAYIQKYLMAKYGTGGYS